MKRILYLVVGIAATVALAIGLFRIASPTVDVENRSGQRIEEFVLELPTSRVSIGPIAAGDTGRVFVYPQSQGGSMRWTVSYANGTAATGQRGYEKTGQWFRTLRFTVGLDGVVELEIDG